MTSEIPQSALGSLAIFPLPDVVLFPGAVLPIHVFEERYRDLAADVMNGSKLLAMARLRPGYEADYEGRPPVYEVAGIGYVLASDRLDDGRYNMLLRGVGRIAIEREHPPRRLYREVAARPLVDTRCARPQELSALQAQLVALCDRLAEALEEGGDELRQLVQAAAAPGRCADILAAALVGDPDERQTLLEMLDPADRLDRVLDHLAALLGRIGDLGKMPN
jgi:uncharacterized protein